MLESAEILALLEQGYLRQVDIAPMLGVTRGRVWQVVHDEGFPAPARVIGSRGLWRVEDVQAWIDAKPKVWRESD